MFDVAVGGEEKSPPRATDLHWASRLRSVAVVGLWDCGGRPPYEAGQAQGLPVLERRRYGRSFG